MATPAPEAQAIRLRNDLGITERKFDMLALLGDLEIEVRFETIPGGAEGLSFKDGDREIILVDPSISSRERQRFTLAHELGHNLLGHGGTPCHSHAIHGAPRDAREKAANRFAATLLLPPRLFRPDIKAVHLRAEELTDLAGQYEVSLTSTAIRYTQMAADCCAVVGVRSGMEPWLSKSPKAEGWWFRLPPHPETLIASRLDGDKGARVGQTPMEHWVENYSWRTRRLLREEIVQTSSGTWLVLLSDLPEPDDDPDVVEREADEDLERRRQSFRSF